MIFRALYGYKEIGSDLFGRWSFFERPISYLDKYKPVSSYSDWVSRSQGLRWWEVFLKTGGPISLDACLGLKFQAYDSLIRFGFV
jgi:hypothetical protein